MIVITQTFIKEHLSISPLLSSSPPLSFIITCLFFRSAYHAGDQVITSNGKERIVTWSLDVRVCLCVCRSLWLCRFGHVAWQMLWCHPRLVLHLFSLLLIPFRNTRDYMCVWQSTPNKFSLLKLSWKRIRELCAPLTIRKDGTAPLRPRGIGCQCYCNYKREWECRNVLWFGVCMSTSGRKGCVCLMLLCVCVCLIAEIVMGLKGSGFGCLGGPPHSFHTFPP